MAELKLFQQLHAETKVLSADNNFLPTPPRSPKISLPSIPRSSLTPSITTCSSTKSTLCSSHTSSSGTLTTDDSDSISLNNLFPTPPNSSLCSLPSVPRSSSSSSDGFNFTMNVLHSRRGEIGSLKNAPHSLQKNPELDILNRVRKSFDILESNDKQNWIVKRQDSILSNINAELPLINQLQNVALSDSVSITSLPTPPASPNVSLPSVPRSSPTSSLLVPTYPQSEPLHRDRKRKVSNCWDLLNLHQQMGDQEIIESRLIEWRRTVEQTFPKPPSNVIASVHPPKIPKSHTIPADLIQFDEDVDQIHGQRGEQGIMSMNRKQPVIRKHIPITHSNVFRPTPSPSVSTFPTPQRSNLNVTPIPEQTQQESFKCTSNDRCCCFKCCCCVQ